MFSYDGLNAILLKTKNRIQITMKRIGFVKDIESAIYVCKRHYNNE